jgi:nucleoredoxin
MSALSKIKTILKGGEEVPASSLDGKVVGIYFSAHWCPPCRGFTPKLVEWYKNFKANHPRADDFEIVFASSDRDEAAFKDYFAEMPWAAIPYADRKAKDALSREFKVQGIPTFVIVNEQRELMTKSGRDLVSSDPNGEKFPWAPKPFAEIFGNDFVRNDGTAVKRNEFKDKYVGIYFSAHWCGPCRGFTPQLTKTYKKILDAGKPFEIVFASSDRDQGAFDEYFKEMPWLAIPYADRDRKTDLSDYFEVQGIPTFVILDPEGKVVTDDGRSAVMSDKEGAEFPWIPKPCNELTGASGSMLNDSAVVIAFTSGDEVEVAVAKSVLEPIAEEEAAVAKAAGDDQIFFMYTGNDDMIDMVRDFAKLGEKSPLLVLLDIPRQAKYVCKNPEITMDNVRQFVADYKAGKLEELPVRG